MHLPCHFGPRFCRTGAIIETRPFMVIPNSCRAEGRAQGGAAAKMKFLNLCARMAGIELLNGFPKL